MMFNSDILLKKAQSSDHKRYGNVIGSSSALLIAQTLKELKGLGLVITDNNSQADILSQELEFFIGDGFPVLNFPDWETLPYDTFSPHQDIISDRLRTLMS